MFDLIWTNVDEEPFCIGITMWNNEHILSQVYQTDLVLEKLLANICLNLDNDWQWGGTVVHEFCREGFSSGFTIYGR